MAYINWTKEKHSVCSDQSKTGFRQIEFARTVVRERSRTAPYTREESREPEMTSLVAVDDAEGDNDSHAAETKQRQDEPAVLEATRYDVAEEQRRVAGAAGNVMTFGTFC